MILAFTMAGAALAAFLPVAHAACALYGFPIPLVLAAMLAGAAVTARAHAAWSLRRIAAAPSLLAAACVASVTLVPLGRAAFVAGAAALAVAAGVAAAVVAGAASGRMERLRLAACASLGAACSAWFSVHVGAPWLGMHGLSWAAAGACAVAAIGSIRLQLPERASADGDAGWTASLRTAAISAAIALACVAWTRALAATLAPTPTVFAAGAAAPLAALSLGLAVGLWLSRRPWAARVAAPSLVLAAVASAHPVPPVTHAGAVTMALGGSNTATYAAGVLVDVLVSLGPLCVLAGIAAAVLASARPAALLAGGSVGLASGVVLVTLLGAVPGATFAAAGMLLAVAAMSSPRRPVFILSGTAIVALVSVHAWRLGPLPVRCGVPGGATIASRWDVDAFRASSRRSDGVVERFVDSVVVSGDGREWHSARVAAHLGAMLAPDARTVLLAGFGRDEARQSLLTYGRLSVEESDRVRSGTSGGRGFDLILHRPPILYTWGAGGEYSVEAYETTRAALAPGGVFVQEIPLRTAPLAHLKRVLAGFVRAFPQGSAWFVRESLVLVGGRGPVRVELSSLLESLSVPAVYAGLSSIGICRPWDLLGMYLCDGRMLASRVTGERPLSDDEPSEFLAPDPRLPFAFADGLAWLLEGRQGVGGSVIAGTSRGERWLIACRLERLRKESGFALAARLKCEQASHARTNQDASVLTAECLNAATQALKIDPGDRYAYETLASAARRLGQTAEQHAKAPPEAPPDPPPPTWWTFKPRTREKEIMWLLDRLDTERGGMRLETLLTIESLHDPSVAPLVAELATDPDPLFRAGVAGTIERLGNPAGAPAMVGLLTDREWNVRRTAAQALGKVGGRSEVGALLAALEDEDASVRETAYAAIGEILKTPLPSFDARAAKGLRDGQVKAIREWWRGR